MNKWMLILNDLHMIMNNLRWYNWQGKSEGFDSCDRPSNLTQIGFTLSIIQPMWPWHFMDDLEKQQGTSSILCQALCIISKASVNSNLSYSPETLNSGQIEDYFVWCDLEIWRMTLKNNRAPLLCCFKLSASWVLTSVTLTFDLWPWPFAWTSLLSLIITPENFMMIRWWEHSEKGVTDGQTDRRMNGRTEPFTELLGRS